MQKHQRYIGQNCGQRRGSGSTRRALGGKHANCQIDYMLEVISIILTAINNNQFFIREGMDFQLEDVPTGTHLLSCEEYTAKQGKVLISGFFHVNSVESLTIFLELSRTYLLFSTLLPLQNQKHYCRPLPHAVAYRLIPQNNTTIPHAPWSILFKVNTAQIHLYPQGNASSQDWDSLLGRIINKTGFHEDFKPIRKIGKGASASVLEALRLRDNKRVAVKAFSKSVFAQNQKLQDALLNEVRLLRLLSEQQQQNVLCLSEVYESENSIYLVMDLCSGGMLHHRLASNPQQMPIQLIKQIIRQLLKGLAHIHSKNIAHRDIKLNNILLRNKHTFEIVIADMGLATQVDADEYLFTRCGTPGYVAPEVIQAQPHQKLFNPHCDIFSLGVIFHFLLTGRPVFEGQNMATVFEKNLNLNFDLTHQRYQLLGNSELSLLKEMLKVDPFERISAEEALQHPFFSEEEELKVRSPVITGMIHQATQLGIEMDIILETSEPLKSRKEFRKASHL